MSLFEGEPPPRGERFETLLRCRNVVVERIVSSDHVDSQVYHQPQDEWVALLRGQATLEMGGQERHLSKGDCLFIPAHEPHRVVSCSGDALWLAVHIHPAVPPGPCDIGEGSLSEAAALEERIPEFDSPYGETEITRRVGPRKHLCLLARIDDQPAGYKLGYEETPSRFYSWIGGVVPAHRRRGVAQQLLHAQEAWCRAAGYDEITVKSRNRFRGMVRLLVQNGYDILATQTNGVIAFRKTL